MVKTIETRITPKKSVQLDRDYTGLLPVPTVNHHHHDDDFFKWDLYFFPFVFILFQRVEQV